MGMISISNLKKAVYYLKRNGVKNTWYAARERLEEGRKAPYCYVPPEAQELESQRQEWKLQEPVTFSIVVPAYRTEERFLEELVESLLSQTYPHWELILADATPDNSVEQVVRRWGDERIRYCRLESNAGIAGNTNAGIAYAKGTYVGLLDHDDVLTKDSLHHMAQAILAKIGRASCRERLFITV